MNSLNFEENKSKIKKQKNKTKQIKKTNIFFQSLKANFQAHDILETFERLIFYAFFKIFFMLSKENEIDYQIRRYFNHIYVQIKTFF